MSYELYLARVTEVNRRISSETTNPIEARFRCRILPMMEKSIADSMCPLFPSFFKDQPIIASNGDLVWVVANKDFSLGYVLGLASSNEYTETAGTLIAVSEKLHSAYTASMLQLFGKESAIDSIKVEYTDGTCIHFIDRSNGRKIIIFDNGTIYIMARDEFAISIADGPSFTMKSSGVSINGESIALQSEDVGLGMNATNKVLTTSGIEGKAALTSDYVKA